MGGLGDALRGQECQSAVWVVWPEKTGSLPQTDLTTLLSWLLNQGVAMDGWYGTKGSFTTSRHISGVFPSKNARICWLTYRYAVEKV